jgi:hypothetical protein
MKKFILILLFFANLSAYEFVLLNKTDISDEDIIDRITSQIENYYNSDETNIEFNLLEDKEAVIKVLDEYDYSGDDEEKEQLLSKFQDLEDDLKTVFETKYILIVEENVNSEERSELSIVLKVNNMNYFDTTYVMPELENKEQHYIDTITNVVLTYLTYKDKEFIKIHQL